MKKIIPLIFLSVFSVSITFCQNSELSNLKDISENNKNSSVFRISLLFPGIIYEYGLSYNMAIRAEFNIAGFVFNGQIIPQVQSEYRVYYNFNKRKSKSKSIDNFSGSFISCLTGYLMASNIDSESNGIYLTNWENVFYIGPTWGLQRNINSFHFEFNLGMGFFYYLESKELLFNPIVDFSIGFRIFKI